MDAGQKIYGSPFSVGVLISKALSLPHPVQTPQLHITGHLFIQLRNLLALNGIAVQTEKLCSVSPRTLYYDEVVGKESKTQQLLFLIKVAQPFRGDERFSRGGNIATRPKCWMTCAVTHWQFCEVPMQV